MSPLSRSSFWALHQRLSSGIVTFRKTTGPMSSPKLLCSFLKPFRLNCLCHMPRLSCTFSGNSFGMGRHAERMRLLCSDFYRGYRSAEEEEIVIHFICQCPSLTRCRCRLFGSSFLVRLMKLSSIVIKDIASYIELSGWFSSVGRSCFDVQPLR